MIELYHVSEDNKVLIYIDGEEIMKAKCGMYTSGLHYNENSLGCSNEGSNCFQGEMSAVYFFKGTAKELQDIRKFLSLNRTQLHNLIERLSPEYEWIGKTVFLHANPKCIDYGQRLYILHKDINIFNSISSIQGKNIIHQNTPAQDIFTNIGGIKTIIPTLHKLIKQNANKDFL